VQAGDERPEQGCRRAERQVLASPADGLLQGAHRHPRRGATPAIGRPQSLAQQGGRSRSLFRKPGHALAVNEALPSFEHNSIVAWRACTKPKPIAGRGSVGSDLKQACSKPTSRFWPNNLIRRARAYRTVAGARRARGSVRDQRADILSEVCVARETVRGFLSPKAQWTTASRRVEVWRGDVRLSMSVSAPFVWRCLSGSAMAPFPHPAHR
jgi:hypothetical protein